MYLQHLLKHLFCYPICSVKLLQRQAVKEQSNIGWEALIDAKTPQLSLFLSVSMKLDEYCRYKEIHKTGVQMDMYCYT